MLIISMNASPLMDLAIFSYLFIGNSPADQLLCPILPIYTLPIPGYVSKKWCQQTQLTARQRKRECREVFAVRMAVP